MVNKKEGCSCIKCIDCCWRNPGWFGSIQEVKNAAKLKSLSMEKFCERYLIREYFSGKKNNIYVPAPRRNFKRVSEEQKKVDEVMQVIHSKIEKKYSKKFPSILEQDKQRNGKGFVIASFGHNFYTGYACIFLTKNNKCSIHKSKPTECRKAFGCSKKMYTRNKIVSYWKKHQNWIKKIANKI